MVYSEAQVKLMERIIDKWMKEDETGHSTDMDSSCSSCECPSSSSAASGSDREEHRGMTARRRRKRRDKSQEESEEDTGRVGRRRRKSQNKLHDGSEEDQDLMVRGRRKYEENSPNENQDELDKMARKKKQNLNTRNDESQNDSEEDMYKTTRRRKSLNKSSDDSKDDRVKTTRRRKSLKQSPDDCDEDRVKTMRRRKSLNKSQDDSEEDRDKATMRKQSLNKSSDDSGENKVKTTRRRKSLNKSTEESLSENEEVLGKMPGKRKKSHDEWLQKVQSLLRKTSQAYKMSLAKALFDNIAETPDELPFRRGDILNVLEKDPNGLSGWWLCSFKGRKGICPGNRLKIVAGTNLGDGGEIYQTPPSSKTETNWNRRSWHQTPEKVLTPQKIGNVYIYEQPNKGCEDYDIPPSRYFPVEGRNSPLNTDTVRRNTSLKSKSGEVPEIVYDSPQSKKGMTQDEVYDIPSSQTEETYDVPPSQAAGLTYDVPLSNRSSSISMLSTGSTATMSSSLSNTSFPMGSSAPPSTCGSARSSTDIQPEDIYDVPPATRTISKSPLTKPSKLLDSSQGEDIYDTPPKAMEIYDTPPSKCVGRALEKTLIEDYDVPSRDTRASSGDSGIDTSKLEGLYDTPQTMENAIDELYDVPPSAIPKITNIPEKQGPSRNLKLSGEIDPGSVYDIPPQVTRDSAISMRSDTSSVLDEVGSRLSSCSMDSRGSDLPYIPYDELPLDLEAAMELLSKRQQNVQSTTSKLLSFVSSSWRLKQNLEPRLYDVQICCIKFRNALQEYVDFGQGALANSAKAEDKKLIKKLSKQLEPLQDALQYIVKSMKNLEDINWDIAKVVDSAVTCEDNDDLGIVVNLAKEVPTTVRTLASLIQGNSTLLFKRAPKVDEPNGMVESPLSSSTPTKKRPTVAPKPIRNRSLSLTDEQRQSIQERPLPPPPAKTRRNPSDSSDYDLPKGESSSDIDYENDDKFLDDYDYVALDTQASVPQGQSQGQVAPPTPPTKQGLTSSFQEKLKQVADNSAKLQSSRHTKTASYLHENDKQLLVFYAGQVNQQSALLLSAIDSFFQCVEYNQPPKVFIPNSKFVILAAHKMVYIGDTIHRNVLTEDIRVKIMTCANYLCDCLKLAVTSTKNAALQYPNVNAVQEMVDRVVDVSHAANELKLVITQAAVL